MASFLPFFRLGDCDGPPIPNTMNPEDVETLYQRMAHGGIVMVFLWIMVTGARSNVLSGKMWGNVIQERIRLAIFCMAVIIHTPSKPSTGDVSWGLAIAIDPY